MLKELNGFGWLLWIVLHLIWFVRQTSGTTEIQHVLARDHGVSLFMGPLKLKSTPADFMRCMALMFACQVYCNLDSWKFMELSADVNAVAVAVSGMFLSGNIDRILQILPVKVAPSSNWAVVSARRTKRLATSGNEQGYKIVKIGMQQITQLETSLDDMSAHSVGRVEKLRSRILWLRNWSSWRCFEGDRCPNSEWTRLKWRSCGRVWKQFATRMQRMRFALRPTPRVQEIAGIHRITNTWEGLHDRIFRIWCLVSGACAICADCFVTSCHHFTSHHTWIRMDMDGLGAKFMHDQNLTSFRFGTWSLPWSDWQACGHRRHDVACLDLCQAFLAALGLKSLVKDYSQKSAST